VKLANSSPSSVDVKNGGAITPLPIHLHGVVLILIKNKPMGNFSFDEGMRNKCRGVYLNMDSEKKRVDVSAMSVVINYAYLMKEKIKYTEGDCGRCP
jgi:hypothetical protein